MCIVGLSWLLLGVMNFMTQGLSYTLCTLSIHCVCVFVCVCVCVSVCVCALGYVFGCTFVAPFQSGMRRFAGFPQASSFKSPAPFRSCNLTPAHTTQKCFSTNHSCPGLVC